MRDSSIVSPPGQSQVIAAIDALEEAQAMYSAVVAPVALVQTDRRARFRWRSTTVDLGPIAVTTHEYGAGFSAASRDGTDVYTMSFPLGPVTGEATFAGITQPEARGRSTSLYSSAGGATFRYGTGYRAAQLSIRTSDLTATLSALLGDPIEAQCRFAPRLSLEGGVGSALERAMDVVCAEMAIEDGLFGTPIAAQRFGESLLVRLLHGQRHDYSERLAQIHRPADPRSVRVAAAYLEANLARPVRVAELAVVAGVSARALQLGFQKHRGCTPAEFLRDQRLALARARLLAGGPGTSIASVAKQCGFAHLGRFSARYRARFRELPIETRARAR